MIRLASFDNRFSYRITKGGIAIFRNDSGPMDISDLNGMIASYNFVFIAVVLDPRQLGNSLFAERIIHLYETESKPDEPYIGISFSWSGKKWQVIGIPKRLAPEITSAANNSGLEIAVGKPFEPNGRDGPILPVLRSGVWTPLTGRANTLLKSFDQEDDMIRKIRRADELELGLDKKIDVAYT